MKTNNSLTKIELAGSAHRRAGPSVAITLRVMSLMGLIHEGCTRRPRVCGGRPITRERDVYVLRAGTTLTEVLMSLMIMSIGIVSAATLFPVSALRTLDANKQTNTTIARFNAEAVIEVDPQLVHNPDGSFPPGAASDQTPYNGNTFRGHAYVVDPLGWQSFNQDNPQPPWPYIAVRDYFGNSPLPPVNWPLPRRYAGATMFGSVNPYPAPGLPADIQAAVTRAFQMVTQPDNWKLVTEAQALTSTPPAGVTSVTLDTDADLSSVPATPTVDILYRAVIFDVDGIRSEIRYLTGTTVTFSPPTLAWTSPLPARFDGGNIGKVRIEVADEIYTWMLSVRKRPNGSTNVDVVVFFKRAITGLQEQVYDAVFQPNTPIAPNPDNRVTVNFTAEPVLKRGGYIFDTANGLWYRIAKIENETSTSADLLLDEAIKQRNYTDTNGNGVWNAGEPLGGAILPPQVVNVFPLQHKEP